LKIKALDLDLANINLEQALDKNLDYALQLDIRNIDSKTLINLTTQDRQGVDNLIFDLQAISILSISHVYSLLPPKRHIPKHIKKFRKLVRLWRENPLLPKKTGDRIIFPTSFKTKSERVIFHNEIRKTVQDLLEIDLNIIWNNNEYNIFDSYAKANQLFWDCLQVATTENRASVKDMILDMPEE
jgi:hypothetical protein